MGNVTGQPGDIRVWSTYVFLDKDDIRIETSALSELAARRKINRARRKLKKPIVQLTLLAVKDKRES